MFDSPNALSALWCSKGRVLLGREKKQNKKQNTTTRTNKQQQQQQQNRIFFQTHRVPSGGPNGRVSGRAGTQ